MGRAAVEPFFPTANGDPVSLSHVRPSRSTQNKLARPGELVATSNLWTCSDGRNPIRCAGSRRAMTTRWIIPKPCALLEPSKSSWRCRSGGGEGGRSGQGWRSTQIPSIQTFSSTADQDQSFPICSDVGPGLSFGRGLVAGVKGQLRQAPVELQ